MLCMLFDFFLRWLLLLRFVSACYLLWVGLHHPLPRCSENYLQARLHK
jgi:hypothetical protein